MRKRDPESSRDRRRAQLVEVAANLLATQGPDAVTTRSVALAAGVQAPTIYRLFGDKNGLLDAAVDLIRATGTGVVFTLIDQPEAERDEALADTAWNPSAPPSSPTRPPPPSPARPPPSPCAPPSPRPNAPC